MSYQIAYQQRAINEYEDAAAWYKERSVQSAENFETAVNEKINILRINPKQYRERLTKRLEKYT